MENFMKKLIALLLTLAILFSYTACGKNKNSGDDTDDVIQDNSEQNTPPSLTPTIVVPEYKDYGRGTVDFNTLIYSRPNIQAVIDAFEAVSATVKENTKSLDEQIADITALEEPLANVDTMYSLSLIYNNKDTSIEYWQDEYEYISTNYPRLTQTVENLLVECARSEHKAAFEEKYFGYSLDEYVDGGIYSDAVVELMAEEARLEAEYSSISTANVEITYNGTGAGMSWSGTVDEVMAMAREYFKDNDASYERCLLAIDLLYEKARADIEAPLFVELIKVRRLIANELGYASYSQLAYENMGYDYTPDQMMTLLREVGQYVAPVASDLEYTVFQSYFLTNVQPRVNSVNVINTLYEVYSRLGGDYKDAYSYMLQHGLYDISDGAANRYHGAFTAYLTTNESPYLFMTSSGFIRDYTTIAHEFGHFLDGYINYGEDDSLARSEISSQALELLTVTKLKNTIPARDLEYLEYYTLFSFLNTTLLTQSFYAAFEHMAYSLEYDEITEARLEKIVQDAFKLVYGEDMEIDGDLSYVTLTHTFLYPFYVESYVTAGFVSLDIFFAEVYSEAGKNDGFAIYEALMRRDGVELDFAERLHLAGLDSPFDYGKVKEISDNIYFKIVGKHYYKSPDQDIGAA